MIAIFSCNKNPHEIWKIEIISEIFSQTSKFLKFLLSTIVKTMFQNVLYHWSLVHIKVSSHRVWKLPSKEMAKTNRKQIVWSDSMYNHNDHYLKFCILRSIVLTIQKVCRLDFLEVPRGRCGKHTITSSKTIVKLSKWPVVCV